MSKRIPEGFLFIPSDQQLLLSYLKRWLLRQPLPCEVILERDLYGEKGKNPWELFTDNDPWNILVADNDDDSSKVKKTIYVFTKLSKLGRQGNKNVIRTAGCGKWHGHTAPKDIVKGKEKIGYKRMFTFKSAKKDFEGKGHWITHEYSLSDSGLIDVEAADYVVCRITKDESKNFKKKEDSEILLVSEADTQLLGKRKSREEICVPQQEKTPRWSSPDEHTATVDATDPVNTCLPEPEEELFQINMETVDASAGNHFMPQDPQHSVADSERLQDDDGDGMDIFALELENTLSEVCPAEPDRTSDGTAIFSAEGSVQNNKENFDVFVANTDIYQGTEASSAEIERLLEDKDIESYLIDNLVFDDGSAELDTSIFMPALFQV